MSTFLANCHGYCGCTKALTCPYLLPGLPLLWEVEGGGSCNKGKEDQDLHFISGEDGTANKRSRSNIHTAGVKLFIAHDFSSHDD